MTKLVLLRHGESTWNKENRFTGWTDIDLSDKGIEEAKKAGLLLKKRRYSFDIAHTSYLKRAIRTLWIALDEMNMMWLPVQNTWRLNERHYGALQGLNKSEMAEKFGEEKVKAWRRSYDIRPPPLKITDRRFPGHDKRYSSISPESLPPSESLKDTVERVFPYWKKDMLPHIKKGKRLLVVAHGNSLRALVKIIENMSDEEITGFNIPTGIPLEYEFGTGMKAKKRRFIGNPAEIRKAIENVEKQGKKKN